MFYISADIEGMSGYGCASGPGDKEIMRAHMTATAKGLRTGGAKRVRLTSFHGIPDGLPAFVESIRERDPREFDLPQLTSEFRGFVLLGFHGVAPQAWGHSYKYPNLWLNGRKCGEVTIQMLLAASRGVPTVMLAGDRGSIAEARAVAPDILAVTTRANVAGDEGPLDQKVLDEIQRAAAQAVGRPVPVPAIPAKLKLEVPFRAALPAEVAERLPYPVTRKDLVVAREADSFADIYTFLLDSFECVYEARKIQRARGETPDY